jgi:hypothetical protein
MARFSANSRDEREIGERKELFGDLGLPLQNTSPSGPYMGTTGSPRSSRCCITAVTCRLAAAFWASAQLGSSSRPARSSASVSSG